MIKDCRISVGDSEELECSYAESSASNTWIFVCHGFGGNKDRQSEYLELAEEGYNVVTFSFRGNGDSDGDFIDQNLTTRINDLKAVVEHFEPDEIVLFGTSFGGKTVFHGTQEIDVDAVIAKAPVTYNEIMDKFREAVENKGRFEYIDGKPINDKFFEDLDTYSFDTLLDDVDMPIAIFHGSADTTVHLEFSFKAAEKLDSSIMLEKIKGEKHSFSEDAKDYMLSEMVSWLNNNGF